MTTVLQKKIAKKANSLKKSLGKFATKKFGFFDWDHQGVIIPGEPVVIELFFNRLPVESLPTIEAFMLNNAKYDPSLIGSRHDKSFGAQICILLTVPQTDLK